MNKEKQPSKEIKMIAELLQEEANQLDRAYPNFEKLRADLTTNMNKNRADSEYLRKFVSDLLQDGERRKRARKCFCFLCGVLPRFDGSPYCKPCHDRVHELRPCAGCGVIISDGVVNCDTCYDALSMD